MQSFLKAGLSWILAGVDGVRYGATAPNRQLNPGTNDPAAKTNMVSSGIKAQDVPPIALHHRSTAASLGKPGARITKGKLTTDVIKEGILPTSTIWLKRSGRCSLFGSSRHRYRNNHLLVQEYCCMSSAFRIAKADGGTGVHSYRTGNHLDVASSPIISSRN